MHLPTTRHLALLALTLGFTAGLTAQNAAPAVLKLEFPAASPSIMLKQRVGVTDIELSATPAPAPRAASSSAGLVPYGKVWRTGANTATKVKFSTPVNFGGAAIPAGSYELFTIPGEGMDRHRPQGLFPTGAYSYKQENDVARVTAKPVALATAVETLTIDFNDLRDESATLNIAWEKTRVPVKITVDVVATLVPQIESVMASAAPKKPYANAAMFYLDHKLDLKKAAEWT